MSAPRAVRFNTLSLLLTALVCGLPGWTQDTPPPDPKVAVREIRELVKQGEDAIPALTVHSRHPVLEVRLEATKRIAEIGGPHTMEPLLALSRDNDPEVQIWAIEGLVNIFYPGYLKTGISRTLSRAGEAVRAKFGDGANDQAIDSYVTAEPQVVAALGRLVRGASSMEARATAARGLGVLRAQGAVDDLVEALYSKDTQLMFESLIAVQKIRDPQAGPKVAFLVRDLDKRVQFAALQAVGILRAGAALEDIRFILANMPDRVLEREALTAMAMIADPDDRGRFVNYLSSRDANIRAAAAEGLARINDPQDLATLEAAFTNERDAAPRLSLAFAVVAHGKREVSQFSPLQYLINTLARRTYRNVAIAFLTELTREQAVREAIYPVLTGASKDERTGIAIVLGRSGGRDSIPYMDALHNDGDVEVAQAGLNAVRAIEARLR